MDIFSVVVIGVIAWLLLSPLTRGAGKDRREERQPSRPRASRGRGGRAYSVEVVGESNYQDALDAICGGRTPDGVELPVTATLVLEDSNPYDQNAVRVDVAGRTVGYLPRPSAKTYRQRLTKAGRDGESVECPAIVRGGWDRGSRDQGNFGIWLDLRI